MDVKDRPFSVDEKCGAPTKKTKCSTTKHFYIIIASVLLTVNYFTNLAQYQRNDFLPPSEEYTEDDNSRRDSDRLPPLLNYTTLFPPYIFRTTKNRKLNNWERSYMKKCQEINRDYESILFHDEESLTFVEKYYPEFSDVYKNKFPEKKKGVMRADMFRLLILHHFGGVYFDMDVECRTPIDTWGESFGFVKEKTNNVITWSRRGETMKTNQSNIDNSVMDDRGDVRNIIQLMIGIEFVGHSPPPQFTNWAIAAKPKHKIFYNAVEMIVNKTLLLGSNSTATNKDVLGITGPVLLTTAILQHFVETGYFANDDEGTIKNATFWQNRHIDTLIGDVAVLNKQAFCFHQAHAGSPPVKSKELYVRHWFKGTWRHT